MDMDNTRLVVNLDAIVQNVEVARRAAGKALMVVVKADAYGHGAVPVAQTLEGKCAFFGVSSAVEALELRRAGVQAPLLVLGYTPPEAFPDAIRQSIRPAIFRYEDAEALSQAAQALDLPAPFHFAVDTGMSRIGFQVTPEDAELCARIARLPGLVAEGLFSHFATADSRDLTGAREQAALFARFDNMLRARGVAVPLRHLDNSAGIMNLRSPYEMARCGIITYGLYPSSDVDPALLPIRPALQWLSRVTNVRTLPAGRAVGYGGTYVTRAPTVIATIPVGYADGYRRSLSGRFYVLLHGARAPILGRVCMDQLMVDVTAIPDVRVGDRVVLLGTDGDETITVEAMATAADTFNYELICGISRRVARVYLREGKESATVRYLLG